MAAMVLTDSVARLCDGVLSSSECFEEENYNGLLEYPQYTRPESWRDRPVQVLLSGHHANIQKSGGGSRRLSEHWKKRPDLLMQANLTKADQKYLNSFKM